MNFRLKVIDTQILKVDKNTRVFNFYYSALFLLTFDPIITIMYKKNRLFKIIE